MDQHDEIQQRLRDLGAQAIDPVLQSVHLTAITQVPERRSLRPKVRTAAAFLAGLLLGGSGLAAAGALPDPAQHAAHRVLDGVGIDVPDPERYHGADCGAEVKRNHGAYVRDDHALAKSDCGKPIGAKADAGEDEGGDAEGAAKPAKGPCQGPPPWAGPNKKSMTPEEKAAAKAARTAECGDDAVGGDADESDEPAVEPIPTPSTTPTTEPPSSTTTQANSTTTTAPADTTTTSLVSP